MGNSCFCNVQQRRKSSTISPYQYDSGNKYKISVILFDEQERVVSNIPSVSFSSSKTCCSKDLQRLFKLSFTWPHAKSIIKNIARNKKLSMTDIRFYQRFYQACLLLTKKIDMSLEDIGILYPYIMLEENHFMLISRSRTTTVKYANEFQWTNQHNFSKQIHYYNLVHLQCRSPVIKRIMITSSSFGKDVLVSKDDESQSIYVGMIYTKASFAGIDVMVSKYGPYHSIPMFKMKSITNYKSTYATKRWLFDFAKANQHNPKPAYDVINDFIMEGNSDNNNKNDVAKFAKSFQNSLLELKQFLGTDKDLKFSNFYRNSGLIILKPNVALFAFVVSSFSVKIAHEYAEGNMNFMPLPYFEVIHAREYNQTAWIRNAIQTSSTNSLITLRDFS